MHAFSSLSIKEVKFKNRLVMAPMCTYQSDDSSTVKPFHHVHYAARALGGVGTIIIEASAVEARGRISVNDLGLYDDKHIPGLKKLVSELKEFKTNVGIQLAHAGRKARTNEHAIAPSAIPFSEQSIVPKEANLEDIEGIINCFISAANRANEAGFDFIEIHAAHGYLINQFLTPLANNRKDSYAVQSDGTNLFLKKIIEGVKTVWPNNKPIFIRFSAEEYHEDGLHVEDIIKIIQHISKDVDVINVSSGGVVIAPIDVKPRYQLGFAKAIREKTGLKTLAGGLIQNAVDVKYIFDDEVADFVYIGRALLRNPNTVMEIASDLEQEDAIHPAYKRAF